MVLDIEYMDMVCSTWYSFGKIRGLRQSQTSRPLIRRTHAKRTPCVLGPFRNGLHPKLKGLWAVLGGTLRYFGGPVLAVSRLVTVPSVSVIITVGVFCITLP